MPVCRCYTGLCLFIVGVLLANAYFCSMTRQRNPATVLAHTLFIVILFVLPELMVGIAFPHRSALTFYPGFYLKAFFFLAVFYTNYFWLVDRSLGRTKPRILKFVAINFVLVLLALSLYHLLGALFVEMPRHPRWDRLDQWQHLARRASWMTRDAVMMILVIGLAAAMRLSTRLADVQLQKQKLISAQNAIELDSLRRQLNPHFLFNTLNTIYALIDIDSDTAKEAVHKLSGMLRQMLYENEPAVALSREAELLTNYTELMRLRMGSGEKNLEVVIDIDSGKDAEVPSLLFIPLIENAFKYGLQARPQHPIRIRLAVESGRIVCTTSNGFDSGKRHGDGGGGIGLANMRRRLSLIYGNTASLGTRVADGVFEARLSIPLSIPRK